MNGEGNDMMDEPMDTAPPLITGTKNKKDSGSELMNCESITNCSNSNGTDNVQSDYGEDSSEDEFHDSDVKDITNNQKPTSMGQTENNDKIPQENHCSNSNESYQDSVDSPLGMDDLGVPKDNMPNQATNQNTATDSQSNLVSDTDELDELDELSEEDIESDSEIQELEESSKDELNDSDIILIENSPLKQNGNKTDEIEETTSEDKYDKTVTDTDDKNPVADEKLVEKPALRRSSRSIKRLSYKDNNVSSGGTSDLEVIAIDETMGKNKPIVINDTKKLFDMAASHRSNNFKSNQTQLVIIDSNSRKDSLVGKTHNKASMNAVTARNLYQSIAARGTTVTPVPARGTSLTPLPAPAPAAARGATVTPVPARVPAPAPPPSLLPSLTDDMFVVEAPSFIVPYVYEKPSIEPFREFVDILGKQLEEEKAKDQKVLLEKANEKKEKKVREKKESKDRGEEVSDSEEQEEDDAAAEAIKQKKLKEKAEKKARRQEDDGSWDGESSAESEDIPSDEDVPELKKQKDNNLVKLEGVVSNLATQKPPVKSENYFDCSLGKFFTDVGSSLVQEYVQADLLKQQSRKLVREKKSGQNTRETQTAIASLMKNLEFSKENNAPFSFTQQKCEFCSFKTESSLVMANHLETPHMKNNLYHCNFCEFSIRSSGEILVHMEKAHAKRGRLERAPAYHPCVSCPFEDNGKGKLARHLLSCAKKFKPEVNLAPPVEWEPPAKLPKMIKMKPQSFPSASFKNMGNMGMNMSRQVMNMGMPNMGNMNMNMKQRARAPTPTQARGWFPAAAGARAAGVVRHNLPTPVMISNYPGVQNKTSGKSQPSISITPLPRAPAPQAQTSQQQHQAKGSFVICEICDGYIKDLEQLRNHMQWIHKVKIHPKMIYNRPPLNCQKCQFRFFTDQGLERHLLGSHGLVTSSMQEAANKGKDAGRCPVCGRVYQWKLLNHVARDHNLTLKPAHLSYKCTVCTATFGMYKQFENHVYSAHRVVAKRVMDKNKIIPAAAGAAGAGAGGRQSDSLLKPIKINDEVTITPQPAKPAAASTSKGK